MCELLLIKAKQMLIKSKIKYKYNNINNFNQ